MSQQRKGEGRPFQDLVTYGKSLEHCFHPAMEQKDRQGSWAKIRQGLADLFPTSD